MLCLVYRVSEVVLIGIVAGKCGAQPTRGSREVRSIHLDLNCAKLGGKRIRREQALAGLTLTCDDSRNHSTLRDSFFVFTLSITSRGELMAVVALISAASTVLLLGPNLYTPSALCQGSARRCWSHVRCCVNEPESKDLGDWRDLRAKLVAAEQREKASSGGDSSAAAANPEGFVFESPLIEQGSVILGGTRQEFGFALRQQYFHKSVMLLLQHDDGFTRGIILNRPSAYEIDGWRVWFGGDVGEGGMFRGKDAKGDAEIVCLHSLVGEVASRLSIDIIRGVSYTTLEGAKALVAEGLAQRDDFWVFVGYAGWAPDQLQRELERDSWFLASADGGLLLQELLRQGRELPPVSSGVLPGDGLATWEKLMSSIRRMGEVERTRGSLEDRMLGEWCRVHLLPRKMRELREVALVEVLEEEEELARIEAELAEEEEEEEEADDEVLDEVLEVVLEELEEEPSDQEIAEIQSAELLADAEMDAEIAAEMRAELERVLESTLEESPPDVKNPLEPTVKNPLEPTAAEIKAKIRETAAGMVDAAAGASSSARLTGSSQGAEPVPVGTVLRSGRVANRFLLADQFLHKSLLLALQELPSGTVVAAVLNRPTANLVQFRTEGNPRRCISFGGDGRLRRGDQLEVDANGLMWLSRSAGSSAASRLGVPLGTSGLRRVNALEAAEAIRKGDAALSDFLLISGVVFFGPAELQLMLSRGELCIIEGREMGALWPQVMALDCP